MGLATILAVEGRVFYNSCSVCSSKVDLLPDSDRGWCKACRACTMRPNKRYRLSLQVNEHFKTSQVTVFGHAANELFGCSANEFFKKLNNSNCSEAQLKVVVERTLLGEMIRITRSGDGKTVTKVTFVVANNTTRIVDKIEQSFDKERSVYSPIVPAKPTTPLRTPLLKTVINSTPLSSQSPNQGALGDAIISPIGNPEPNKTNSSDTSYTRQSERRGKRRRCRVQCMVVDPLTQDSVQTESHVIQPPGHVIQPPDHVIQAPDLMRRLSLKSSSTESLLSDDEGRKAIIDPMPSIQNPKSDQESISLTQGLLLNIDADPTQELEIAPPETAEPSPGEDSDYDLEFDDTPSIELPYEEKPPEEPIGSDENLFDDSDKDDKSHDSDDFDSFEVDDVITDVGQPPQGSNSSNSTNTINNSNPRDVIEPEDFNPRDVIEPEAFNPRDVIEPEDFNPRDVIEPEDFNPRDVIEPEDSQEDLFDDVSSCIADIAEEPHKIPESPIRKPKREFDWSILNEMSSQEISKHFDFRLSDTDDESKSDELMFSDNCSNRSDELF